MNDSYDMRLQNLRQLDEHGVRFELLSDSSCLYVFSDSHWVNTGLEAADLKRYLVIYRSGEERSAETYDTLTEVEEAAQLALFEPVPFVPELIIDLDTNRYHGHSVQIRVLP